MTKAGAISGLLAGFLTWGFWVLFVHAKESSALGLCKLIFNQPTLAGSSVWAVVDPIVIGLPVSILVTVIISLLTSKPSEKEVARSFGG